MRWVIRIAVRFLKASPFRSFPTSIGVALGVALTAILFMASHSAQKTLTEQVELLYGKYDLQFGYMESGRFLTDQQVQKASEIDGVSTISKVLIPYLGTSIPAEVKSQPTYWGVEPNSPEMKIYKILDGRYPKEGAEVAITAAFANRTHLKVGDKVSFPFPPHGMKTVEVVGILQQDKGSNIAFFPLSWLQETLQLSNQVNLVQLELGEGANKNWITYRVKEIYSDVRIDPRPYVDKAYEQLNMNKPIMYGLGAIVLLMGAILVMGSFILSVRSRSEHWAALQALGSSSRQIVGIVVTEALLIGIVGSLIGILVGDVLCFSAESAIKRLFEIENFQMQLSLEIMIIVFLLGVTFSVIGAFLPAMIARKVSPAQVLRPGQPQDEKIERRKNYWGFVFIALGLLVGFCSHLFVSEENLQIANVIGGFCICVGFLIAIPQLFTWIVTIFAVLLQRLFGVKITIAARNVIRYRKRAAFAVAILALGIAIAFSAQTFKDSTLSAVEQNLKEKLPADLVIRINENVEGEYLNDDTFLQISQVPGVQKFARVAELVNTKLKNFDFRKADAEYIKWVDRPNDPFDRDDVEIYPADTVRLKEILSLTVVKGKGLDTELKPGEAFMPEEKAKQLGIDVGDVLTVETPRGPQNIKIVSLVKQYPMLRGVPFLFVQLEWGMETFGSQGYVSLHLDISPTVSTEKVELQVQRILHDQPNAEVVSFQNKKNEQQSLLSQQMFLIQALIFVVFLISGIGLMNAIVSSLHDRRREIAILQAIGITPGQLLQILALEGMYMGVGGGIIGAAGGGILAYFLLQAMEISQVAFPWETGGILLAVSILLGIFASLIATTQVKRLSLSEALKII